MTFRFGLGPVFAYEWLLASRRWQIYAMRSCLILCLGTGLGVVWYSHVRDLSLSLSASASVGESFFYALVGTQLSLLLIAAPAATAGAVCHDKKSGALVQLLTTDLSNTEIVLGKLAARLLPILALLLASVPLLFGAFLLGGIPEEALVGAYLVQFGIALLGCSLALTLSVWSKKTHEVLLVVYLFWTVVVLGAIFARLGPVTLPLWLGVFLDDINPYVMAFMPYLRPGAFVLGEQISFFVVCLGFSAILTVVAIVRVRAATLGQWGQPDKPLRDRPAPRHARRWRWLGPRLDPNPVLWREWHRRRPSRWIRGVWLAYVILAIGSFAMAFDMSGPAGDRLPAWVSGVQVLVGLLLASVTAVTSLADERLCGSLDVLLTTPLSTRQIVLGKWLASFRTVLLLAILPTSVAAILGLRKLDFLPAVLIFLVVVSAGALFVSLGLLVAAWSWRQSRALMLFVSLYLLAILGPFLVLVLRLASMNLAERIAIGSPWLNVTALTIWIGDRPPTNSQLHGWAQLYIGIYMLIALWLYCRLLATSDRCLGRVTKRSSGASRGQLSGTDLGPGLTKGKETCPV